MASRWSGTALVACALLAGCARPEAEQPRREAPQAASPAQVVPPQAAPAARDTPRAAPPAPVDTRPWVPAAQDTFTARPAAPRPAQSAAQAPGGWTAGTTRRTREGAHPALVRAIRTARNAGWDRVVFEFEGGRVPGYHVEYVDRPVRRCGSGDETAVAGEAWLQVSLTPAHAHTEAGRATVRERERKLSLGVLRELEMTCDFEADVTVVLGVARPNRYRVMELSGPARLVVDVRH